MIVKATVVIIAATLVLASPAYAQTSKARPPASAKAPPASAKAPARPASTAPGADVNRRNPDGSTPLQWAVYNGDVAEVKDGLVKAVRRGEAAILVRYEGIYATRLLTIMGDRSGYQWIDVAENNFIDLSF